MDLLGSIMNKMEKPPVIKISVEEQQRIKKQQESLKKIQDQEKKKLKDFREDVKKKINDFLLDENQKELKFEPNDKIFRSIIHDIADTEDLQGISYGIDGTDRHVVVYKKDSLPSNEEITCLKRGEVYDPVKIEREKKLKEEEKLNNDLIKKDIRPSSNYQDKYKHIIGEESGKSAAQIAKPNLQFGCVPSSNKRDVRSIEQTLADLKKKKQKCVDKIETVE